MNQSDGLPVTRNPPVLTLGSCCTASGGDLAELTEGAMILGVGSDVKNRRAICADGGHLKIGWRVGGGKSPPNHPDGLELVISSGPAKEENSILLDPNQGHPLRTRRLFIPRTDVFPHPIRIRSRAASSSAFLNRTARPILK